MSASAEARTIGVLPIEGRPAATELVTQALRGIEGISAVSLSDPGAVLGADAASALAACSNDRCRVAQLTPLALAEVVLGEVARVGGTEVVRLRLVDSSTPSATVRSRVSFPIADDSEGALRAAVVAAVQEVLGQTGDASYAELSVRASPEGATVSVDGQAMGTAPVGPLRLKAGPHDVRVSAPRHHDYEERMDLLVGDRRTVSVELDKRRSLWPLYLLGGAAAFAGAGVGLRASAQGIANRWVGACDPIRCQPGFTRERYDSDRRSLGLQRDIGSVFLGTGVALAVGSLVYFLFDPGEESGS